VVLLASVGQAVGQSLPFAVGIAASPPPIIVAVLILVTPRGRSNGPAYLVGWVLGLAVVGTIVLVVAPDGTTDSGGPATWESVLKLVLGLTLLVLAAKQFRGRQSNGAESETPKWMGAIDDFSALKALGAGVALSAANPKNLLFAIGAEATIAEFGISAREEAIAFVIFLVIASLGVGVPVAISLVLGDRAAATLEPLKAWLIRNNALIMGVLLLLIGATLVGEAIAGFST
jgi:threonine/homoserine/homoserine lactone efflux protein